MEQRAVALEDRTLVLEDGEATLGDVGLDLGLVEDLPAVALVLRLSLRLPTCVPDPT